MKLTKGRPPQGMPTIYVPVKFPTRLHQHMKNAAKERGQTLSEFIRFCVANEVSFSQEEEELG